MNTNTPQSSAPTAPAVSQPEGDLREDTPGDASRQAAPGVGEMDCPNCGAPMPDLKGGHATICSICGYKDSCCY